MPNLKRTTRPTVIRRILFLILSCSALIPARANLGETIEQLVARYGKPTGYTEADAKTPFGTILFRAAPYDLVVFVVNNKEVGARVSKVDKSAFSDAEIKMIMAAETGSGNWTPSPSADPSVTQWSRGDQATALYDKDKHMLIFTSEAMAQAVRPAPVKPTTKP
jgi:hypothetical protein